MDIISERGLSGFSDEEIIRLCIEENRLLLTFDSDFNNIFRFPIGSNPGIILIKIKPTTIEISTPTILSFLKKNEPSKGLTIITKTKVRICKKGQPTITIER